MYMVLVPKPVSLGVAHLSAVHLGLSVTGVILILQDLLHQPELEFCSCSDTDLLLNDVHGGLFVISIEDHVSWHVLVKCNCILLVGIEILIQQN